MRSGCGRRATRSGSGRTNTPISIAVGTPIQPFEPAAELTAQLRSTMQDMLTELQRTYEHPPGAYWVPAKLGGSAPTLEEANRLDAEEAAARAKARADREQSEQRP